MIWHHALRQALIVALGAGGAGCSTLQPTFACEASADCVLAGAQGTCEPVGFCSFPRASCASGRAFGEASSEALAGTCVPIEGDATPGLADGAQVDGPASIDALRIDGAPDDIRRVGASIAGEVTASQLRILSPAPTAVDDLLWLTIYTDLQDTTVGPPAGWQLYGEKANTADNFRSWFFYRIADEVGASEHTFTFNRTTVTAGGMTAYRNVATVAPFDAGTYVDTSGNPFTIPSITASAEGGYLVASYTHDEGQLATWAVPSGTDEAIDVGWVAIFDRPIVAEGATGTFSAIASVDALGAGALVALRKR